MNAAEPGVSYRRSRRTTSRGHRSCRDPATRKTVLLTQHYRAANEGMYRVLDRIRHRRATPADIERVPSRTFGHPDGPHPTDAMWKAAPLVIPRNFARQAWN